MTARHFSVLMLRCGERRESAPQVRCELEDWNSTWASTDDIHKGGSTVAANCNTRLFFKYDESGVAIRPIRSQCKENNTIVI